MHDYDVRMHALTEATKHPGTAEETASRAEAYYEFLTTKPERHVVPKGHLVVIVPNGTEVPNAAQVIARANARVEVMEDKPSHG